MKKRKVTLGLFVAIFCVLVIPTVIISLAFFPSPVKQVKEMKARQHVSLSVPKGTELRIAYGKEGPAEPHIVRVAPLPSGGHAIITDLGKIDK